MAVNSVFPETINFDGTSWRLVYDPSCTDTVMPSINERDVQGILVDAVTYPGRQNPMWLIMVNIVIPASTDGFGKPIGARRMIGFRIKDQQPLPSYRIKPNELVYYAAAQTDGSVAQRFFNSVTILSRMASEESDKPDTSWIKQFSPVQPPAQQSAQQAVQQMPATQSIPVQQPRVE